MRIAICVQNAMEPSIAPKPTVSEHACASSCRTDSSIVIESSSYEEKPKAEGIGLQLEGFIKLLDKERFGLNEGANRGSGYTPGTELVVCSTTSTDSYPQSKTYTIAILGSPLS